MFFFLLSAGFVGYYMDSKTTKATNQSVYIGDKVDRDASIVVNNCTRLVCRSEGTEKVKIPCQGKWPISLDQRAVNVCDPCR